MTALRAVAFVLALLLAGCAKDPAAGCVSPNHYVQYGCADPAGWTIRIAVTGSAAYEVLLPVSGCAHPDALVAQATSAGWTAHITANGSFLSLAGTTSRDAALDARACPSLRPADNGTATLFLAGGPVKVTATYSLSNGEGCWITTSLDAQGTGWQRVAAQSPMLCT